MLRRRIAIVIVLAACLGVAAAKDIAVVSNKANATGALTLAELAKLCKGSINQWADGKPASCVIRQPGSLAMKVVLDKVYSSSAEDLVTIIEKANRGRTDHPAIVVVDTDAALVKKVESTPGAIGLVDVYSITGGVNVLRIGGKLPLEPGYSIHGN